MKFLTSVLVLLLFTSSFEDKEKLPIVIAHRGASGYLPEHTTEAVALALGMGADYIEQDVVLTKDHIPIVLHDIHLESTTNVAKVYPKRKREDGRYYAIDFTLSEIKTLKANERIDQQNRDPVFPNRFPENQGHFQIPTLAEEIELIQGFNQSVGRVVGIYPEIKNPKFHRSHDADISKVVLELLKHYGYRNKSQEVFLQCFDEFELKRIYNELKCELPLIQLIESGDLEKLSKQSLVNISGYSKGIGPYFKDLLNAKQNVASVAQQVGLDVHPYTFRADRIPTGFLNYESLVVHFHKKLQVNGLFTDHPDQTIAALKTDRIAGK